MVFCEVNFLLILVLVSSNSHTIFKFSMTTDILQRLLLSQETSPRAICPPALTGIVRSPGTVDTVADSPNPFHRRQ